MVPPHAARAVTILHGDVRGNAKAVKHMVPLAGVP
jgi:hypothetical protein